jgi:hypothetical protein
VNPLQSIDDEEWARNIHHLDYGDMRLDFTPGIAWHGRHHTVQITRLDERMGS